MRVSKLQRFYGRSKLSLKKSALKKSSPTILSCMAAVGVVITTVMAVRATPKAIKFLQQTTNEKDEELSKIDMVLSAAPAYVPTVMVGLSTIACILGANLLSKRNQTTLVSAYALLNESYKEYRNAACSVYGKNADSKIKTEMAKDVYVSADGYGLYSPADSNDEVILFYDSYSKRYFEATMASVINAQYHVNRNLQLRGYVDLNEFYGFLGIDKVDGGDAMGWAMDELIETGLIWLDFDNMRTELDDGLECYIIESVYEPIVLY